MRRFSARPRGGGSTGCVVLQATGGPRAGDRRQSRFRNGAPFTRFAPRLLTRGVPGGSLLRVPGLQVLWRTLDTRAGRLGVLSGWQDDAREVGVSPLRHRRIDHAHPALLHPRSESPRDFPRLPRSARPLPAIHPRLHVCGHNHASTGAALVGPTLHVNASMVNSQYAIAHKPFEIELEVGTSSPVKLMG